jgi:hypothetical protein
MLEMAEAYASKIAEIKEYKRLVADYEKDLVELKQKIANDYVLKEHIKECIYFGDGFTAINDKEAEQLKKLLGVL